MVINTDSLDLFPELGNTKNTTISNNSLSFKKVVTNVIKVEKPKIKVKPGWTNVSFKDGKIVYEHGKPTKRMLRRQKQEELNEDFQRNVNIMINKMLDRWKQYEADYNEMNGTNSYADKYRLPSVYESEEEYEDDDEDEDCEYDEIDLHDLLDKVKTNE